MVVQEESKDEPSQNVAINDSDETPKVEPSDTGAEAVQEGEANEEFFDAKELLDDNETEKNKDE